jgi:hypothetical protein
MSAECIGFCIQAFKLPSETNGSCYEQTIKLRPSTGPEIPGKWERFFIKDHVKSLKRSVGSIIEDPEQIETVVSEMEKYRGGIEGGLCIRRLEDFITGSERRYFVLNEGAGPSFLRPHPFFATEPAAPPQGYQELKRRISGPYTA